MTLKVNNKTRRTKLVQILGPCAGQSTAAVPIKTQVKQMVASSTGWALWPKVAICALHQASQIKTHAMLEMTQRNTDRMKKLSFAWVNLTKTCSTANISWIWKWCLDWRIVVWPMTRQVLSCCGSLLIQTGRPSRSPCSNETLMCSDSQLYRHHFTPLRRQGSRELHHASRGPV